MKIGIEIKRLTLSTLVETTGNPQRMTDKQYSGLVKSMKDKGWLLDPPVAWLRKDGEYQIISGHHRIRAAIEAGIKQTDCKVLSGLTEAAARKLVLEANQRRGEFDDKELNKFINSIVVDFDIDIDSIYEDIGVIIDDVTADAKEDDYEIPDKIETDIKLGDLFAIGEHLLLCGDSSDMIQVSRMMGDTKADMVFTDPPYGVSIGKKNRMLNSFQPSGRNLTDIESDQDSPDDLYQKLLPAFKNIRSVMSDDCTVFVCSPQGGGLGMMMMMMKDAGLLVRHVLIWKKNYPTFSMGRLDYDYQHEPILLTWGKRHKYYGMGKHRTSVWEIDKPRSNKEHPTMKPIALMENALLNNSKSGDICIDFFLGSGSTMVACHQLNRKCYGIELSPQYCQVIINRMKTLDPKIKITKIKFR